MTQPTVHVISSVLGFIPIPLRFSGHFSGATVKSSQTDFSTKRVGDFFQYVIVS